MKTCNNCHKDMMDKRKEYCKNEKNFGYFIYSTCPHCHYEQTYKAPRASLDKLIDDFQKRITIKEDTFYLGFIPELDVYTILTNNPTYDYMDLFTDEPTYIFVDYVHGSPEHSSTAELEEHIKTFVYDKWQDRKAQMEDKRRTK